MVWNLLGILDFVAAAFLGLAVAEFLGISSGAISIEPRTVLPLSLFPGARFLGLMLGPVLLTPVYESVSIRGVLLVAIVILIAVAVILRWDKTEAYQASVSRDSTVRP